MDVRTKNINKMAYNCKSCTGKKNKQWKYLEFNIQAKSLR